jgi:hypothetical protein
MLFTVRQLQVVGVMVELVVECRWLFSRGRWLV